VVDGSDLFVANLGSGTIGEYTTSGATENASLISGLDGPFGIVMVHHVPQPASLALFGVGFGVIGLIQRRSLKRQRRRC
jgi:hypothetical protein